MMYVTTVIQIIIIIIIINNLHLQPLQKITLTKRERDKKQNKKTTVRTVTEHSGKHCTRWFNFYRFYFSSFRSMTDQCDQDQSVKEEGKNGVFFMIFSYRSDWQPWIKHHFSSTFFMCQLPHRSHKKKKKKF